MKKNILMVLAHPDDEILFGWPIFFDKNYNKKIIMCSTDANNKDRQWCAHRKHVMSLICKNEKVEVEFIDNNSSFYKTQTRRPSSAPLNDSGDSQAPYRSLCQNIVDKVKNQEKSFDYIFTHNPYGEYGHKDHILIFDLILKNTEKPMLVTDIIHRSNWSFNDRNSLSDSCKIKKTFYKKIFREDCQMDVDKFNFYKSVYQKNNCWTWWREEINKCNLFIID